MKLYFTLSILIQLIPAFLSGNKNKTEYLIYLLKGQSGQYENSDQSKERSIINSKHTTTTTKAKREKYTFLLER